PWSSLQTNSRSSCGCSALYLCTTLSRFPFFDPCLWYWWYQQRLSSWFGSFHLLQPLLNRGKGFCRIIMYFILGQYLPLTLRVAFSDCPDKHHGEHDEDI